VAYFLLFNGLYDLKVLANLWVVVILGINKPSVVDLISTKADSAGLFVPIPTDCDIKLL
jgi:hypothetical protein